MTKDFILTGITMIAQLVKKLPVFQPFKITVFSTGKMGYLIKTKQ
jgi:hypothetical protein